MIGQKLVLLTLNYREVLTTSLMTSPPTNSIWSKVEKALDTHTLSQLHLLSTETPKSKRKSGDQLSAEKDKPKKLNKIYSENGTPDSHVSTPDTTNTTLNMETNHGARPKMIRIPSHQLPPLECIAAFTTRDAILTKVQIMKKKTKFHHQPSR